MSEIKRELTTHHDGCGLTELCRVGPIDEPHPVNGAHHRYVFQRDLTDAERLARIEPIRTIPAGDVQFQYGPRNEAGSTPGVLDGVLLAVLIDRYECFQAGPFACGSNEVVLDYLRCALEAMKARAQERAARCVLGTNQP